LTSSNSTPSHRIEIWCFSGARARLGKEKPNRTMPVLLAWGFIIKVCMQTFSLLTSKLREEIEVTLTIQKFMVKMIFL